MKQPIHPYMVYTTEQAAELLEISVVTIQRYIRSGKLNATKVGKWYRLSGQVIQEFMGVNQIVPALEPINKCRQLENDYYAQSLNFLMNHPTGRDTVKLFELSTQTLVLLLNPDANNTEDQLTIKYIGTRTFNDSIVAFRDCLSGYYQVSLVQQRVLVEAGFLLDLFRTHPEKIKVWRDADDMVLKNEFSQVAIRKLLDHRDNFTDQKRKMMYQQFCKYAAHITYSGFTLLTNDSNRLEIGPFYNQKKLMNTLYELTQKLGILVIYLGSHLTPANGKTALTVVKQMELFDKVFNFKLTETEKFKESKANIEALVRQLPGYG